MDKFYHFFLKARKKKYQAFILSFLYFEQQNSL